MAAPETMFPENAVRICAQCGKPIVDDYGFCPACGFEYEVRRENDRGSSNIRPDKDKEQQKSLQKALEDQQKAYNTIIGAMQQRMMENNCKLTLISLAAWLVIGGLLSAISLILSPDQVKSLIGTAFLSKDFYFEGIILLASVILAALALVCVYSKKNWKVAYVSCFVSSAVTLGIMWFGDTSCIYFLLFGLLCTLRIKSIKPLFIS